MCFLSLIAIHSDRCLCMRLRRATACHSKRNHDIKSVLKRASAASIMFMACAHKCQRTLRCTAAATIMQEAFVRCHITYLEASRAKVLPCHESGLSLDLVVFVHIALHFCPVGWFGTRVKNPSHGHVHNKRPQPRRHESLLRSIKCISSIYM